MDHPVGERLPSGCSSGPILYVLVLQRLQVSPGRVNVAMPQQVLEADLVHPVLQIQDCPRVPKHVSATWIPASWVSLTIMPLSQWRVKTVPRLSVVHGVRSVHSPGGATSVPYQR
jgi:hypothetical protein